MSEPHHKEDSGAKTDKTQAAEWKSEEVKMESEISLAIIHQSSADLPI